MSQAIQEDDGIELAQSEFDTSNKLSMWSLLLRGGENINSVETLYSAYWTLIKIFQSVVGDLSISKNVLNGKAINKFLSLTLPSTKKLKLKNFESTLNSQFLSLSKSVQNLLRALIDLNTRQSQKEDSITKEISKVYWGAAKEGARCIYSQIDALLKMKLDLQNRGRRLHAISSRKILGEKYANFLVLSSQILQECYEVGLQEPPGTPASSASDSEALESDSDDSKLQKIISLLFKYRSMIAISKEKTRALAAAGKPPVLKNSLYYDKSLDESIKLRLHSHVLNDLYEKESRNPETSDSMINKLKMLGIARVELNAKLAHAEIAKSVPAVAVAVGDENAYSKEGHAAEVLNANALGTVERGISEAIECGQLIQIESSRMKSIIAKQQCDELAVQSTIYAKECSDCIREAMEKLKQILSGGLSEHALISAETRKTQKVISDALSEHFKETSALQNSELPNFHTCLKFIEEAGRNRRLERDMFTFSEHKAELHKLVLELKKRLELVAGADPASNFSASKCPG